MAPARLALSRPSAPQTSRRPARARRERGAAQRPEWSPPARVRASSACSPYCPARPMPGALPTPLAFRGLLPRPRTAANSPDRALLPASRSPRWCGGEAQVKAATALAGETPAGGWVRVSGAPPLFLDRSARRRRTRAATLHVHARTRAHSRARVLTRAHACSLAHTIHAHTHTRTHAYTHAQTHTHKRTNTLTRKRTGARTEDARPPSISCAWQRAQ